MLKQVKTAPSPAGISFIVCCYNSAKRIAPTYRHLQAQLLPETLPAEIIIVDNASTDDTAGVISSLRVNEPSPLPVHWVKEEKQGLIYARMAGLAAAQYECIVFADDDNWLMPEYGAEAARILDRYPAYGLLGGFAQPVTDGAFPDWFFDKQQVYACGGQMPASGDTTGHQFLWGAGLCGRRSVLQLVFDAAHPPTLTGRKGNQLVSGDDDEINGRVWLLGYHSFYSTSLQLKHYVAPEKLTTAYLDGVEKGFAAQAAARSAYFSMYRIGRQSKAGRLRTMFNAWAKNLLYNFLPGHSVQQRINRSILCLAGGPGNGCLPDERRIRQYFLQYQQ